MHLESRYVEFTGTYGSEEGFTPTHPPMEFGEMVDWRPLDGTPSLKRQRAEDDQDGIQMENCESCEELTDVDELHTSADDMVICDEVLLRRYVGTGPPTPCGSRIRC